MGISGGWKEPVIDVWRGLCLTGCLAWVVFEWMSVVGCVSVDVWRGLCLSGCLIEYAGRSKAA